MRFIKLILKIPVLPVLAVTTLIQWICIFLNMISGVIFGILSTVVWATALLSLLFGQSAGREILQMLAAGFIIFIIPHVGNWIIVRIVVLRCYLGDFLRS